MVAYDFGVGQFFSGAMGQLYPGGDSKAIEMDVEPQGKDGRTFIPVRYASELLGMTVEWVQETKEVLIYDLKN